MKHIQDPFLYKCVIQRIVDGDTIDALIDVGFDISSYRDLRPRDTDFHFTPCPPFYVICV